MPLEAIEVADGGGAGLGVGVQPTDVDVLNGPIDEPSSFIAV
jgi:hypothetical protein